MKYYLVCTRFDGKSIGAGFVQQIEDGGSCGGVTMDENLNVVGSHNSSSLSWLYEDLKSKVDDDGSNEYVDYVWNHDIPCDIQKAVDEWLEKEKCTKK